MIVHRMIVEYVQDSCLSALKGTKSLVLSGSASKRPTMKLSTRLSRRVKVGQRNEGRISPNLQ